MSIRKRKVFFYVLLAIFLLGGGAVAFYSQGYRFDYKTIAIKKVGGIFVKSEPTDALIFLDGGEIKNQSWLLQNGTLIGNLIPDTYTLELKLNGYRPWRKLVTVQSSLVTEADTVKLIRDKGSDLIDSDVKDVRISGTNLIEQKLNGSLLINNQSFAATGTLVTISPDQKSGIFLNTQKTSYFLHDFEASSSTLNISLLFNNLKERILQSPGKVLIKSIAFYPADSRKLFIIAERNLYLMDKEKLTLALLDNGGVHYFKVSASGFFWVNDKGELKKYNYQTREREKVMADAADLKNIEVLPNSQKIAFAVLKANGLLSFFDPALAQKQTVANQVMLMAFSPDTQKILFIDRDGKINVQNLSKKEKKASFVLPTEGTIDSIAWHKDSEHFFIRYTDGRIYFSEIDGTVPVNTYLVGEHVDAYVYDGSQDALFMLRGTDLLKFPLTE